MIDKSKRDAFRIALGALYSKDLEKVGPTISPEIINFQDRDGRTLLMMSIRLNHIDVTEKLIKTGADLNLQDKKGWTALHFAAQFQSTDLVALLLRYGAKADAQDMYGNSSLWRAVFDSKGVGDVIDLLLKNGANPNLKNHFGVSPIDLANTIANYDVKQFFSEFN
jgi:ankyrin repeat protein